MHKYKKIPVSQKLKEKFETRVNKNNGSDCWEWAGTKQTAGYGVLRWKLGFKKYTMYAAHRVSFAIYKQEKLKSGMVIDHICRNRGCVNPSHLRQMSIIENAMRDSEKIRLMMSKTNYSVPSLFFSGQCSNGHKIESFNQLYSCQTQIPNKQGSVVNYKCIKCNNENKKKLRKLRKGY